MSIFDTHMGHILFILTFHLLFSVSLSSFLLVSLFRCEKYSACLPLTCLLLLIVLVLNTAGVSSAMCISRVDPHLLSSV